MMENTKLGLVLCIVMSSCVTLCVSSSFDADLSDYLGGMMGSSTCMEKLLPCQPFLVPGPNPPPANCCIPLKNLIANDTKCICDTFNNPLVRGSLNVSMDDIMKLPKACNETFDIAVCNATTAAAPGGESKTENKPAGKANTASLDSGDKSSPAADTDSSQDNDTDADPAQDADQKASGANEKFVSSFGREYVTTLAFFVAFVLSVY